MFGAKAGCSVKNLGLENVNIIGKDCVGGLLGDGAFVTIENCYVTGIVAGGDYVGGLAGFSGDSLNIFNSYTDVSVTGSDDIGGLVGCMYISSINNCYALGNVLGASYTGGLVGGWDVANTLKDSYYDKETNGQTDTGKGEGISSAEIREKMIAAGWKGSSSGGTTGGGTGTVQDILFQIGIHSNAESQIALNTSFALTNLDELRNIGLSDGNYFETIDNILASISAKQTEYGACQNRLESALEEINTHYENLLSSRSTLRDADVAQESSAYIRNQILQQASATLLATANQSPSVALQLL